ncbi:MAG: substrate-binding domain-containing protein [Eubacteriales bacterium]|nr:substrate-binding domain-containing protein [Eubacteriales bacterium]
MTKKAIMTAALAAAMLGSTIGAATVSAEDYSDVNIEIISKGFQHQYWQAVLLGANNKAAELGCTINFVGPNSESDIADQVQMLDSAINASPSAIGLAALDTEACLDSIGKAQAAGIPIIGFDSGVPGAPEGAIWANAATDNYAAGELAAEKTYEAIKDRIPTDGTVVRIGILAQDATGESVVNRGLGFIDKMAEFLKADGHSVKLEGNDKYVNDATCETSDDADVIIETLVPSAVTSELSAIDCQTLLNKDDIIAIYGSNQHSGEAMVTGNENLMKFGQDEGQIIGVAFDSGAVIKAAVADGTFIGAVTQAPVSIGEHVVELACKAAHGEDVADVDTGCQWYTAENMEDPEIAPNLYD